MKQSTCGKISCVSVGIALGWCIVVVFLLGIMHSGSLFSFNQSFAVLTVPIVGLLSLFGFIFGFAGCFIKDEAKTSVYIGMGINGILLLICGLATL